MMEVQRQSLQTVRDSDKIFSAEGAGLSPPVSTGLSLGVNGMDNIVGGYVSSVTSTRSPLPNTMVGGYQAAQPTIGTAVNCSESIPTPPLVPAGVGDFMSLSPPGIVSGNQAVFLSSSAELPACVRTSGVGTMSVMPPDVPVELRPENEAIVSREFNQSLSRDIPSTVAASDVGATGDVEQQFRKATEPDSLERSKPDIPSTVAASDIGATGDVEQQFRKATEPDSLERSKPDIPSTVAASDIGATGDVEQQFRKATELDSLERSTPDLNIGYNDGDTQRVTESQSGDNASQSALAGETQPVDDDEGFDDMVVLQNDTLTASTIPLEKGGQPALLYVEPLQLVDTPPLETLWDVTTSTPSGVTKLKALGNGDEHKMDNVTGVEPHVSKLSSGEPEPSAIVPGANERVLDKGGAAAVGGQTHTEEGLDTFVTENKGYEMTPKENSSAVNANTEKKEVVTEQDIQAIMGRKVMKKFGKKDYKGEVVEYDSENHWFKVVYEDGDQEDLELVEVKEILFLGDTISHIPTVKRKNPLAKEGSRKQPRKQKTSSQDTKRLRGRPRKKDSSTQTKMAPRKVMSLQELKSVGPKTGVLSTKSVVETERELQAKSRGKRKRSSDVETEMEIRTGAKVKKGRKRQLSTTKPSIGKSSPKKGARRVSKKGSTKRKGTRRRSSSNLPAEQNKDKQRKVNTSEHPLSFVGKMVEKDFDGILYKGKVMNFDTRSEFYKVKYDDGDQEDLELEELKVVLVE